MTPCRSASFALLFAVLMAAAGCSGDGPASPDTVSVDRPEMETKADSVAMTVLNAMGGPQAWASLPYLRFDFGSGTESDKTVSRRHFWNRMTGDYRIEMPQGEDSVYVVLFNVHTREGNVYLNGEEVGGGDEDDMLERAYSGYINDTYWLLMPVKLFDPGVNREYVADSSNADEDVIHLSFGDVGLTPGDQYWVYVDKESGRVDAWAYRLQRHPADYVPQRIEWAGYETFDTPHGEVVFSERKPRGGSTLFTDNVAVPTSAPDGMFTDPQPML